MKFSLTPTLAAVLASAALAAPGKLAAAESLSRAPTNAGVLPLLIAGRDVPDLRGAPLLGLSLFRCAEGRTSPVVFQVDEINDQDRVVSGDAHPDVHADEAPGLLDDNDQIVLMQRDIGGKCTDEQLARVRGKLAEIEITGAALLGPGYLYALSAERGHVPSSEAVRFDRNRQTISTPAYVMSYSTLLPHVIETFILHELRGRETANVLDRLKIRMDARALGSFVQIRMTEEDVHGLLLSARAGPVRVVREVRLEVRPVPGLSIPATVRFENFERLFRATVRFKLPRSAAFFVSSLDLFMVLDYIDARGIRISTGGLPQGAVVDGRTAASERQFDLGAKRWFFLSGEGINHVSVLHMEEGLNLRPTARFSDGEGEEFAWPPERVPGGLPQVGYGLLGWQDLEARWYQFGVDIGFLPSFPDGGGDGFTDAVGAKFTVRAKAREGDAPAATE